jgi:Asp-tRNA(Asn)/Glu-tRNA(Gln) amidotransferase C subunit
MDKREIQKQAKEILDKFAKALEGIEEKEDFYVDRGEFEREEKDGGAAGSDKSEGQCKFKDELLENAPRKDDDFVLVEKGDWKK